MVEQESREKRLDLGQGEIFLQDGYIFLVNQIHGVRPA